MLSIKLQRVGKHKAPMYRVIVTEKRRDPWGKNNEILGNFNPNTKELNLKEDRVTYWLSVGAQPTDSVRNMLINAGLMKGNKAKAVAITKKRQAKMNEKQAEAAEKAKEAEEAKKAEAEAASEEQAANSNEETGADSAPEKAEEAPAEGAEPVEGAEEKKEDAPVADPEPVEGAEEAAE